MANQLEQEISNCTICANALTLGVRPIVSFSKQSKIVVIGQAPGLKVHQSGIPWDDKSGETLRKWMNISDDTFYNPKKIAIVPMGFCYPGKGKSGDLPPRKECAPQWHHQILSQFEDIRLIVLIGKYAQEQYLGKRSKRTLTETVKNYHEYLPQYFVLPHPSPRNNIWMAKNPWFKETILPEFESRMAISLPS